MIAKLATLPWAYLFLGVIVMLAIGATALNHGYQAYIQHKRARP